MNRKNQENGESKRASGTHAGDKPVSARMASTMSPSTNPQYKRVPSKRSHAK